MNPANVPPWGCPWHGLVERLSSSSAHINLPNGQTKTWPVYALDGDATCDTVLVRVPGVPPVERTPEEQAADDAAGRQWWNQAILGGSAQRLHGRAINGWVYCDPAGRRWRVSKISGTSGSYTVELQLFGELGRAAEIYSYPVSVADMGQSTPSLNNLETLTLKLRDVCPDGSRALYAVRGTRPLTSAPQWPPQTEARWIPALGWLEMSISGPGESATISLEVLVTRAQAVGVFEHDTGTRPDTIQYWQTVTETVEDFPDKTITTRSIEVHSEVVATAVQFGDPYADGTSLGHGAIGERVSSQARRGAILAMWYAADGTHETLTLDVERTLVGIADPVQWVVEGEDVTEFIKPSGPTNTLSRFTLNGEQSSSNDYTDAAVLNLGGVELTRIEVPWSSPLIYRYDRDSGVSSEPASEGTLPVTFLWLSAGFILVPSTSLSNASNYMTIDRFLYENQQQISIAPYQLSNHMWTLLRCDRDGSAYNWTWGHAWAPGAVTDSDTTTITHTAGLRLYGSWCPVTGQMARATYPVIWA